MGQIEFDETIQADSNSQPYSLQHKGINHYLIMHSRDGSNRSVLQIISIIRLEHITVIQKP